MTATGPTEIDPSQVLVIAVGIEDYEEYERLHLPGAAAAAMTFAQWTLRCGVPAERVWLAASPQPPDPTFGGKKISPTASALEAALVAASHQAGELLLFYWCGHGVMNDNGDRAVITSDVTPEILRNLVVDDILRYLKSQAFVGSPRQIVLIDACAAFAHESHVKVPAATFLPSTGQAHNIEQNVLFAAGEGEVAYPDRSTGGTFSQIVLDWLQGCTRLPPDFNTLQSYVATKFEESRLKEKRRQFPVSLIVKNKGDETQLYYPVRKEEPAYWETAREIGRNLHSQMPQLLQRDDELRRIAAFATSNEGYYPIVGEAFSGKTALLYEAVNSKLPEPAYKTANATLADEVDVVCYFLRRRAADADSSRFLSAVVPQLAYLCGTDAPAADQDQFLTLWRHAVESAEERGRHLLLVVDGLDEDLHPAGSPSIASLLPALVGGHAHVLLSSRPSPELSSLVADGHPLKAAPQVELEPLKDAQTRVELAEAEIDDLMNGPDAELAMATLGFLTAAAGPLSLPDLATLLSDESARPSAARIWQLKQLVEKRAARSLEWIGPPEHRRYIPHKSLLAYAQQTEALSQPEYRDTIHRWADRWRTAQWPLATEAFGTIPNYLVDSYPVTLTGDPERAASLLGDIAWAAAAICTVGVDQTLANLRTLDRNVTDGEAPMLGVVAAQSRDLRPPRPVSDPAYVLRQLCLQATFTRDESLAEAARTRQRALSTPGPVLLWTSQPSTPAEILTLGSHGERQAVRAVVEVDHERVVTGGRDGRLLLWDVTAPGAEPVQLGRHEDEIRAMVKLNDGRLVSGDSAGRLLLWNPTGSPAESARLGRHDSGAAVLALAVWDDEQILSVADDGRLWLWSLAPGAEPLELGRHEHAVLAIAKMYDGGLLSGESDGGLLRWYLPPSGAEPVPIGRHNDGVVAVSAVSARLSDCRVRQIVSGGRDGRVLLWVDGRGVEPVQLRPAGAEIAALVTLADGRIAGGIRDGRVLLWNPAEPEAEPVAAGRHAPEVLAVAELSGGRLVTGGRDGRILLWDLATPGAEPLYIAQQHSGAAVRTLAVSGDGSLVSADTDGRLLLWEPAAPGHAPVEFGRRGKEINALVVAFDGQIVSGGSDGRLLLWDRANPAAEPVHLGRLENGSAVLTLVVSDDGHIVSGDSEGRLLLWDPANPAAEPVPLGRHRDDVRAVAKLRNGRIVTGESDGALLLWDKDIPGGEPVRLGRCEREILALAEISDGRIVTGGSDGRVLLWNPANPGSDPVKLGRLDPVFWTFEESDRRVTTVAALPDGGIVTGLDHGWLLLWDPGSPGAAPIELGAVGDDITAMDVLDDGRIVTGTVYGRVFVWDPYTQGAGANPGSFGDAMLQKVAVLRGGGVVTAGWGPLLLWDLAAPSAGPRRLGNLWSPKAGWFALLSRSPWEFSSSVQVDGMAALDDGRFITATHDGRVLVWDPASPDAEPEVAGRDVLASALTALDDGRIVVGSYGSLVVWNKQVHGVALQQLARIELPDGASAEALAAIGEGRVVVVTADGAMLVVDVDNPAAEPVELRREDHAVITVTRVGKARLASGGRDGRVLLWNIATPDTEPVQLGQHDNDAPVLALAALANGRIVSGGGDRRLLLWDPETPGRWIAEIACDVQALGSMSAPAFGSTQLFVTQNQCRLSAWSI